MRTKAPSRYTLRQCVGDIREDLRFYSHGLLGRLLALLLNVRTQLVVSHRIMKWLAQSRLLGARLALLFLKRWQLTVGGCDIAPEATIGRRLTLPHPIGIVIGIGSVLGDDVTLYQHVTLGTTARDGLGTGYPKLGDGVVMYAGAVAVGGVSIGSGAVVGALTLVREDVAEGGVVVGVPGRRLK